MISLQRSMHSSQMYTPGPAINFFTCFCDLPQNEHFSSSPPSPNLATSPPLPCSASACPDGAGLVGQLTRRDDLVDDAVVLRFFGFHYEIPVGVLVDLLHRLARVLGQDLVQEIAHPQELAGLDLDVGRLAGAAPPRL